MRAELWTDEEGGNALWRVIGDDGLEQEAMPLDGLVVPVNGQDAEPDLTKCLMCKRANDSYPHSPNCSRCR